MPRATSLSATVAAGVGVPEDVPSGFDLHFEFWDPQRPRTQSVRKAAFEVEKAHHAPRILGDARAVPLADGKPRLRISQAIELIEPEAQRFGPDILVRGTIAGG